ncbi:MAG: HDOD domain-containing protein [Candidatus Eiseniibacteriota bacterium]
MSTKSRGAQSQILALSSLPPMPEVLARIWQVSDDPKLGARELAEVVGLDPGLSSEVLRTVNGAQFGLRQPVQALREAIVLLGVHAVRGLSLTLLVRNGLRPRGHRPFQFDRVAFWRHCVSTAIAAEIIARTARLADPELAYVAGLLHDVGIMVLDNTSPEQLGEVVQLIRGGMPLLEADIQVLECTHADIGRLFAERWQFPQAIVAAIASHHEPHATEREFQAIACAVLLADTMFSPETPACYSGASPEHHARVASMLKIEEATLARVHEQAIEKLAKASDLLSVSSAP